MNEFVKLGDIAKVMSLPVLKVANESIDKNFVKLIQLKDVDEFGNINIDKVEGVYVKSLPKDNYFLRKEDILVKSKSNGHISAVIREDINEKYVASSHYLLIRVTDPKFMPEFVSFILNTYSIQKYMDKFSQGTYIKILKVNTLTSIEIPSLSIEEQEYIVEIKEKFMEREQICSDLLFNYRKERQYWEEKLFEELKGGR